MQSLVRRQEALARKLLRKRASALCGAPVSNIRESGGDDAKKVEAIVIVEPLIFDRDQCVKQIGRNLRQRLFDPLLLENRERQAVGTVVHRRGLGHLADASDRVVVGESAAQARV